ncbi:MAG: hypothetical protein ACRDZO_00205 [Egibacteraceae bacterium]
MAEAYHRTVPAANACARRLLASPAMIESLLRTLYLQLWEDPPQDVALEAWVRGRCFTLARQDLLRRGAPAASPSAATLLPDLPAPDVRYLDAAERALSELDDFERTILLRAHDCGIDAGSQSDEAVQALDRSLRALAGPETSSAYAAALLDDPCTDVRGMGDWVLGLAPEPVAAAFEELVSSRPGCAALARTLKRGRRRLEGLPPTPDMGHRILVTVLSTTRDPETPKRQKTPRTPERVPDPVPEPEPAASAPTTPEPAGTDPAEIATGEMRMDDLLQESAGWSAAGIRRADRPQADDSITSTEWPGSPATSSESATSVVTREKPRPRVVRILDDLAGEGGEPERLPDPDGQTTELASFESLFSELCSEEELITRPSVGQRALVAIGYVLPIAMGAVIGLYIADMLFNLNR